MTRQFPWRAPATIILALAAFVFLGLGLRTFLWPVAAAAYFGVPTTAPEALAFVQAYGARNIAISLTALALIALDARAAMAALLAATALVAALDASIMFRVAGMAGAAKHLAYIVLLVALAWVAWRGAARPGRATPTT